MTCDEVMEFMQRHLDGDLNEGEHKRMSEHLDACPDCADMMERLQQIDQDLANLPKVTPAFSLVDAILPRLEQIDAGLPVERADAAASEMHLAKTERTADAGAPGEGAQRKRPWYARGRLAQFGGLAAAAAVFGILIVNGLPKSLDDATQQSMNSTAGSAAAPMARVMESSAAETGAAEMAAPAAGDSAAEAPLAEESTMKSANTGNVGSAGQNAISPKEPAAEPLPVPDTRATDQEKADTYNNVGIADAPEPNEAESDTPHPRMAGEAAPEPDPAPAPVEETISADDQDGQGTVGVRGGGGSHQGFAPEDPKAGKIAAVENQYGSLSSETGKYEAQVRPQSEDGRLFVVIVDETGATVFASTRLWDPSVPIELKEWKGEVLTYTALTADGTEYTFTIDAAAGTETEIK